MWPARCRRISTRCSGVSTTVPQVVWQGQQSFFNGVQVALHQVPFPGDAQFEGVFQYQ